MSPLMISLTLSPTIVIHSSINLVLYCDLIYTYFIINSLVPLNGLFPDSIKMDNKTKIQGIMEVSTMHSSKVGLGLVFLKQ